MSEDTLFSFTNAVASITWIILIIFQSRKWLTPIVLGVMVTLLALLYFSIIVQILRPADFASFSTLDGIQDLFENRAAVLAGWVHYLAFDLMVGLFIVNNATKYNINRWLLIPCLLLTFMLGPIGLLLYIIIRTIKTRKYFLEY